MKKTVILISLLGILFTGCIVGDTNTKQEWTSLIYPDKQNTKRSKKSGIYPTLEECRKASLEELSRLELSTRGTYQCGLNCNFHEGMKIDVCEKLSK